jgi:hypothetical protein
MGTMSDVTDLLDQLVDGTADLDAVVDAFRTRSWPRRTRVETHDATDLYALDAADPVDEPEGAFAEVAGYLAMHRIDLEQYRVLAEAAAVAMQNAPAPGTPAGAVNERTSV